MPASLIIATLLLPQNDNIGLQSSRGNMAWVWYSNHLYEMKSPLKNLPAGTSVYNPGLTPGPVVIQDDGGEFAIYEDSEGVLPIGSSSSYDEIEIIRGTIESRGKGNRKRFVTSKATRTYSNVSNPIHRFYTFANVFSVRKQPSAGLNYYWTFGQAIVERKKMTGPGSYIWDFQYHLTSSHTSYSLNSDTAIQE